MENEAAIDTRVKIQNGKLGLYSPTIASRPVVTITRGVMSRTGQLMGNVDQGPCVEVTAYGPMSEDGHRARFARERLYAADGFDREATNRIGLRGAAVRRDPSEAIVAETVERLTIIAARNDGAERDLKIRCVDPD